MLDILPNVLLQAMTFGIAAIGVAIAFRVIRYPDLTADGSFMLGSTVFASATSVTGDWIASLALSVFAGAAAGLVTALLNTWFGVSRLLSGILTTMIAYSVAFRLLGGRSNVGLAVDSTMFAPPQGWSASLFALAVAALFAVAVVVAVQQLLKSELGLLLRATGGNPGLVQDLGRSPAVYRAIGLAVANGFVGLAGALVSAQQGFVDINLGVGVVITLVAALVLGEELFNRFGAERRAGFAKRAIAPVVGAATYFLLYLLILRASIQGWIPISVEPTDLKLLSAILVVLVVALRRTPSGREEILPL
jgi:putative ABC transport system permease protein